MPIDKQSPRNHEASREKRTMSPDNGTPATGKNFMPQCHQKTTNVLQKLHKRMRREPGNMTELCVQEQGSTLEVPDGSKDAVLDLCRQVAGRSAFQYIDTGNGKQR